MKYLVLAIIILYLISLSLAFGVSVDVDTDKNVGKIKVTFLFIPIFRKKVDIKHLLFRQSEQPHDDENVEQEKETFKPSKSKRFLLDCAIKILKAVCVKNASLRSKIGTGDAAADGMAVGMLRIMYTQFCAFFEIPSDSAVIEPEYDAEILIFDFFGIFSISFADIIFAVLCVVFDKITHFGGRRNYANVAE